MTGLPAWGRPVFVASVLAVVMAMIFVTIALKLERSEAAAAVAARMRRESDWLGEWSPASLRSSVRGQPTVLPLMPLHAADRATAACGSRWRRASAPSFAAR